MLERFIEEARQAVTQAQSEARELGHPGIGPEHLLLGVLRLGDDPAAYALASSDGVSVETVRERVAQILGAGEREVRICCGAPARGRGRGGAGARRVRGRA